MFLERYATNTAALISRTQKKSRFTGIRSFSVDLERRPDAGEAFEPKQPEQVAVHYKPMVPFLFSSLDPRFLAATDLGLLTQSGDDVERRG